MLSFTDCKINLGLNIINKRVDGYHNIATCMVHVPWHDIIEIVPSSSSSTTLTVLGNKVDCPPEKNLVMKAYKRLAEEYELPAVDIILQKIVPDGAGLGGGSADAAYTLKLLNTMFDLQIEQHQLANIAAKIGADCPFFVYDQPMMCEGIGEIMSPIDINLKGLSCVIAKPLGVSVSTKDAYAGVTPKIPETPIQQILTLPVEQWQNKLVNDFEDSIFAIAPQVKAIKHEMLELGAVYSAMSGSGASVFGIFNNDKLTEKAVKRFEELPHFSFKFSY